MAKVKNKFKFSEFLRKVKIRARILIFLIIFTIVPSVIVFFSTQAFTSNIIESCLSDYINCSMKSIETNIQLLVNQANIFALRLLASQDIYNLISDSNIDDKQKDVQLRKIIDRLISKDNLVGDIVIVTNDNKIYRYVLDKNEIEAPTPSDIEAVRQSKNPKWGSVKKDKNNNSYVLFGRNFRNFSTGYSIGTLFMYINERAIYNAYENSVLDKSNSFILSKDNIVISHKDINKVGSAVFDESPFVVSDGEMDRINFVKYEKKTYAVASHIFGTETSNMPMGWKIISFVSYEYYFETIKILSSYMLTIQLVVTVLAFFLSFYISKKITRPVTVLENKILSFGKGNMNVNLFKHNARDEIWTLEKSFNDMVIQIKELIARNNMEKEKQRESELKALQAQINPHFIYNTLDTISWIAKIKNQNEIQKIVRALASFFRISLHKGDKYITVEEEIEHIKSYITIIQMRFPHRFDVVYDISDEILNHKIIKIILQPLVENAIKHGIEEKEEKGLISIVGYKIDNDIRFEIIDNGNGFDVSLLDDAEYMATRSGGYGIKNVNERIMLEYGEKYGLKFYSKIGKGTRAEVLLGTIKENNIIGEINNG